MGMEGGPPASGSSGMWKAVAGSPTRTAMACSYCARWTPRSMSSARASSNCAWASATSLSVLRPPLRRTCVRSSVWVYASMVARSNWACRSMPRSWKYVTASIPCRLRRVLARSAAEACALAEADSIWRRTAPQKSGSQEILRGIRNAQKSRCVAGPTWGALAEMLLRVAEPPMETVG